MNLNKLIQKAIEWYGPCPSCGYWEPIGCGDINCPRR